MELSKILTQARNGSFISEISVNDASKVIANSTGKYQYSSTIFQKKHVDSKKGDEIVKSMLKTKQTNISEIERIIKKHSGLEMTVHIGDLFYIGIIKID